MLTFKAKVQPRPTSILLDITGRNRETINFTDQNQQLATLCLRLCVQLCMHGGSLLKHLCRRQTYTLVVNDLRFPPIPPLIMSFLANHGLSSGNNKYDTYVNTTISDHQISLLATMQVLSHELYVGKNINAADIPLACKVMQAPYKHQATATPQSGVRLKIHMLARNRLDKPPAKMSVDMQPCLPNQRL